MESWNFASEELDWSDAFARTRRALIQCENGFIPSRESAESFESAELGLPEMFRKTSQSTDMFCNGGNGGGGGGGGELGTLISPNSSLVEDESGSKVSGSLMETNSQDSSLIALKLGCRNSVQNGGVGEGSKERSNLHSNSNLNQISSSSTCSASLAAKRARTRGSYSQTPFCQVHGCNMDLSSSKDYHKKHRVCDVHSKTAKVIVNGIEQRFCQQCSRFHVLAEFDDGKRSCRRRLAGHNERRRKPQLDGLSDKPHKLAHPYQGNRYMGTSFQKRTPFVFSDILPGVILSPDKYEQVNQFGNIKFEDESLYNPQLTVPGMSPELLSKSFIYPLGIGKEHSSGIPTSETEDYCFYTTASIHKPSGASNSTCALSLLSSQPQNLSSSHSTGIPSASHLIMQGAHPNVGQLLDKPLRVRSVERHGGANGFYSCALNPVGVVDQLESTMFPETNPAADFEVHDANRSFQDSHNLQTKYCLGPEHGSTVDLLQLSSHLQRVEHQRNFMQVKQESEDFCCFPTA